MVQLTDLGKKHNNVGYLAYAYKMSGIYQYLNNSLDSAEVLFRQAYYFYLETGDKKEALSSRTRAGIMSMIGGKYDAAKKEMHLIAKEAKEDSLRAPRAFAFNQLGTVFHYEGNADSAAYYYNNSEDLYASIKDTVGVLIPMFNKAVLMSEKGAFDKSISIYKEIVALQKAQDAKERLTISCLLYTSPSPRDS